MAKLEKTLYDTDFDQLLQRIEKGIYDTSVSSSLEESSDFRSGDARCSVRVFERYSYAGGNRVSLNLVLMGQGEDLFLSAITSGGSQALFFKVNTWGEEAFLDRLQEIAETL